MEDPSQTLTALREQLRELIAQRIGDRWQRLVFRGRCTVERTSPDDLATLADDLGEEVAKLFAGGTTSEVEWQCPQQLAGTNPDEEWSDYDIELEDLLTAIVETRQPEWSAATVTIQRRGTCRAEVWS